MHINSIFSNNRRNFSFGYFSWIWILVGLNACQFLQKTPKNSENLLIYRTCDYLWNQQAADGGWHSTKHGILKSGQAYTPFVLMHLMEVPDSLYPKTPEKIQHALQFIRKHCKPEGIVGLSDPDILEYPNYATAFALRVLIRNGDDQDQELIQKMIQYLLDQQFDESRDIPPGHPAYGSWGFGETNLSGGFVGHADLSHTRRVLEALREAGLEKDSAFYKVRSFLKIVQNHPSSKPDSLKERTQKLYDGGFYYSPIVTGANKGELAGDSNEKNPHYRSYATATADGLLASLASAYSITEAPVKDAMNWLRRNPTWAYPQGIPEESPAQWHQVLVLYHLSVRAEAYSAVNEPGSWKSTLKSILKQKQQQDGSFANPQGARNKENDPILGSTLALKALLCTLN